MSFQYRPRVDPLDREQNEIARRRERFEARRTRILNAKERIIGVDVQALDAQVTAKQAANKAESDLNSAHDQTTLKHVEIIGIQREIRSLEEKRRLEELSYFHRQQAAEKAQRDALEKSLRNEYRTAENPRDSTLFLDFAGEDLEYPERQRAQKAQQNEWISHQKALKELRDLKECEEEERYSMYQQEVIRQQALRNAEKEVIEKDRVAQTNTENQYQGHVSQLRRREAKAREDSANDAELAAMSASAFLNEDTQKYNNANVNFKGHSTQYLNDTVMARRAAQLEDAQRRRDAERQREEDEQRQRDNVQKEILRREREKWEGDVQKKLALREEQAAQQREKEKREKYLKEVVYTNPVQESFFQQFGTSHR